MRLYGKFTFLTLRRFWLIYWAHLVIRDGIRLFQIWAYQFTWSSFITYSLLVTAWMWMAYEWWKKPERTEELRRFAEHIAERRISRRLARQMAGEQVNWAREGF